MDDNNDLTNWIKSIIDNMHKFNGCNTCSDGVAITLK
jgi:hypothetical protein